MVIFFRFASENLFSALMSRKGADLSTNYHECSKQVRKDWHSGDFEAKWQVKELHKTEKCFKAFG